MSNTTTVATSINERGAYEVHAFAIILRLSVLWAVDASASTASASSGAITNTLCPVLTDEPVDPNINAVFRGKKVYFCCQKCVRKLTANPDLYLSDLEQIRDSSIANGKTGHDHAREHEHDRTTDHGIPLALCSERAACTKTAKCARSYLIALFLGALLVSVTGHFGGTLVFGTGDYSW